MIICGCWGLLRKCKCSSSAGKIIMLKSRVRGWIRCCRSSTERKKIKCFRDRQNKMCCSVKCEEKLRVNKMKKLLTGVGWKVRDERECGIFIESARWCRGQLEERFWWLWRMWHIQFCSSRFCFYQSKSESDCALVCCGPSPNRGGLWRPPTALKRRRS